MWQSLNKSALEKFCDGNLSGATADWKEAIDLTDSPSYKKNADVAEIYFNLGRCLIQLNKEEESVPILRRARTLFADIEPEHTRLRMIDTALRDALDYIGEVDQVKELNKQLIPEFHDSSRATLTINQSLKILHDHSLVKELHGDVLANLCRRLEFFPDEVSEDLSDLLLNYYLEDESGERAFQDGMVICPYLEFEPRAFCDYLNTFFQQKNFLTVDCPEEPFKQWSAYKFRRFDGKVIFRTCSSAVGFVTVYNREAEECNLPYRLHSLNSKRVLMGYMLPTEGYDLLKNSGALDFED